MNCIIIDDESAARLIIHQLCGRVNGLEVMEECSNAIQAIKYLNKNDIDLIFLDVHMPDFSGFDFIQTLKEPPNIILTTSDRNFAIEAFEYDCIVDYLVKPIDLNRFQKAIAKVNNKKAVFNRKLSDTDADAGKQFYVNIDRRLIKIEVSSIYLIEAKGDYIQIKTETNNYTVHSTLKKIEEKLPNDLFLKVHRSYIINLKKIVDIEDNSVLIKKDVIPISRSNRQDLMDRLNLL
jgi:two-component system, LytTR family, response regulator